MKFDIYKLPGITDREFYVIHITDLMYSPAAPIGSSLVRGYLGQLTVPAHPDQTLMATVSSKNR